MEESSKANLESKPNLVFDFNLFLGVHDSCMSMLKSVDCIHKVTCCKSQMM